MVSFINYSQIALTTQPMDNYSVCVWEVHVSFCFEMLV